MKNLLKLSSLVIALSGLMQLHAADVNIEIKDEVILEKTIPLGVNIGDDNYYAGGVLLKDRIRANFEGTYYRSVWHTPACTEDGFATWFNMKRWLNDHITRDNAKFMVLCGDSMFTKGTVKEIIRKKVMVQGKEQEVDWWVLDKKITPVRFNGAMMLEADNLGDGKMTGDSSCCSPGNEIRIGDVPKESFGKAALCIKGSSSKGFYAWPTHSQRWGNNNTTWRYRFWAKNDKGQAKIKLTFDVGDCESVRITPTDEWTKYEGTIKLSNVVLNDF
ncbi:MAG: hypothetical protein HRU15_02880, partial [Planctomycetes bacterium]|nr:hypothetical protein [Planctomycetota bacterium]